MDIQDMRHVLAIARAGSVRSAAATLYVAPQTLSEQLQRVERSVGAALFVRTSTGMTPTALGQVFLAQADAAVTTFDRAVATIAQATDTSPTPVRFAWAYGLADVLRELLRQSIVAENASPLDVVGMGCAAQLEALAAGEIAAGLVHAGLRFRPPKGLRYAIVDRQPVHALLPRSHRLARRTRVSLADLSHEPLLLPAEAGPRCLREW
ncbi:MAG TPA: LysR family transcriptional regulator, partial [Micromonosporaceae bacterium]